jgi:hypothetical protein
MTFLQSLTNYIVKSPTCQTSPFSCHTPIAQLHHSQIDFPSRPCNICSPMVRINRIFLHGAFVILVSAFQSARATPINSPVNKSSRIEFLEVRINEPLFVHFGEVPVVLHKVALAFERTVVDPLDDLDCQ